MNDLIHPSREGAWQVYFEHTASGTVLVFDDPDLISASGLEPAMRLADRAGLAREHVAVAGPLGAPLKVGCLVGCCWAPAASWI